MSQRAIMMGCIEEESAGGGLVYATWNPADKGAKLTLSESNMRAFPNNGFTLDSVRGTTGKTTGKYYFELIINSKSTSVGSMGGGIASNLHSVSSSWSGSLQACMFYPYNGNLYNGALVVDTPSIAAVAVYGMNVDIDNKRISIAHNGVEIITDYYFGARTTGNVIYPCAGFDSSGTVNMPDKYADIITNPLLFSYSQKTGYTAGWGE